MGAFSDKLTQFTVKTGEQADETVVEVVEEVGRRLIGRSPIGEPALWKRKPPPGYVPGQFVSNWNYAAGAPNIRTSTVTNVRTVNDVSEVPKAATAFSHFISNSLPYATALERGHSTQAPLGMVELTAIEFPQIVAGAVAKVKG